MTRPDQARATAGTAGEGNRDNPYNKCPSDSLCAPALSLFKTRGAPAPPSNNQTSQPNSRTTQATLVCAGACDAGRRRPRPCGAPPTLPRGTGVAVAVAFPALHAAADHAAPLRAWQSPWQSPPAPHRSHWRSPTLPLSVPTPYPPSPLRPRHAPIPVQRRDRFV